MDVTFPQVPLGNLVFGTQCASLMPPVIPGASLISLSATEAHSFDFPAVPVLGIEEVTDLSFCNVSIALTHENAADTVHVSVWLPLNDWNGRYQATGGGGLATGMGDLMLGGAVAAGFAASSTDGGATLNQSINPQTGTWVMKEDGTVNEDLVMNLAWRSIHDMALVAKDIIKQFYGVQPSYSYWHGCSQGGRQGYAAAAKYPYDFDGVLAIAPALNIHKYIPAILWPLVVMRNSGEVPPFCIFEAYHEAIITECDPTNCFTDGWISDHGVLENCLFDPTSLVGTEIACEEGCFEFDPVTLSRQDTECSHKSNLTITEVHADIVSKVLQGPRTENGTQFWWGVMPGAKFFSAYTSITDSGTRVALPLIAAENWVKYLGMRNPNFNISTSTYTEYFDAYQESITTLNTDFGHDQDDFTEFKLRGGKLLTWFGLADDYIPALGTIGFRKTIEDKFGGPEAVDEFYRLFPAPGVSHCFAGEGPKPLDALRSLIAWVERDEAPEVLPATTVKGSSKIQRNLCRYPKRPIYQGGDTRVQDSFSCE